jgi:hypothetical protein
MPSSKSGPDADAVLADALGAVVARMQRQWQRELDRMAAESRAAIAEVKAACLEIVLEGQSPERIARLRAVVGGGRG